MWTKHNPPIKDIREIHATYNFELPEFLSDEDRKRKSITVSYCERHRSYESVMWIFNRGIVIVRPTESVRELNKCIELTDVRFQELLTTMIQ